MGVAEEVLVVSLTCLKYMRRQEDWPHCDEQVRAGNGSLGRRLRQTVEMTGKFRNDVACSEVKGRVGNKF